jgi:hypothetical protein
MLNRNSRSGFAAGILVMLVLAGVSGYWTTRAGPIQGSKDGQQERGSAGVNSPGQAGQEVASGWQRQESSTGNENSARTPKYAWSKEREVYHYYECAWVKKIKPENLQTGDAPPQGKRLHRGCPSKETS